MSGIRVISGSARGRRLKQVSGTGTRPISDRVKEALFNIIGLEVRDAIVLDLFGGTGSVGIEALSRGAAWAVFLDTSRRAIATIRANLSVTGFFERSEVLQTDALTYLERSPRRGFDYIYIAPPQYQGLWTAALKRVDNASVWLNLDGWAIVQIHPSEFYEMELNQLTLFDRRRYGNTMLCFYSLPQRGAEI
ncbi:MAG: 16S rRNA (guanine(966)-N(2))-methyltransferase RsmD [Anaerolineales bacterium]|jgi:16S rRNA (guanine(966)-N(2))-methyltransferase RsmD|nr:16S rRNA (guanine(966)-N(2))-methyltransferase RsmD [Anaerolineales bacterium]HJO34107.1 16S rRNA (guanine(966)-N(2))-methyltransferase RsmD [Anaerolineales bacterium]